MNCDVGGEALRKVAGIEPAIDPAFGTRGDTPAIPGIPVIPANAPPGSAAPPSIVDGTTGVGMYEDTADAPARAPPPPIADIPER